MARPGSSRYVFAIYASGRRVGPKYLEREHAERDARALRGTYSNEPRHRRPTIRVKRILDR